MRYPIRFALALILVSQSAFAEIHASDCERAAKYSESRRGSAVLVMQNGRTIFEHYANDGSANRRWPIFSGTKSFWGIAALAAAQEGLFRLDDPVSDTITEWKSDPRKSQITIRQLLSQTDGIEGASHLQRPSIRDRNAMAIGLPSVAEPGSAFIYGPSHLQIFSELLRRKLRGRSVISYFEAHVANRLGLHDLKYKKDERGNPLPATGFELTAREWARLGELVLGNGNYHRRQIVPSNVLREAFVGSQVNPAYGLTFWLNHQAPNGREADHGANARFALAKPAMAWRLHLQGCACGHGGGAWIALPATIHYSVLESSHCPPGIGRKFFGRAVFATGARANAVTGRIDLLVGLANGQSIMGDRSHEEQALRKIQHEWAEARVKGDASYTRRLEAEDCTIVWPDGRIVNKRGDLQSMTDIEFSEFTIENLHVRLYGDTGIVVGEGIIKAHKRNQDPSAENSSGPTHLSKRMAHGR